MRHCNFCLTDVPVESFRGRSGGRCRKCEASYQRARYAANPEGLRKKSRISAAKRRAIDGGSSVRKRQMTAYYANHDINKEAARTYYGKRFFWGRAMKLRGKDRATFRELARMWKAQRGCCALTGRRLTRKNANLDHIHAQARGGGDSASNLRWVCSEVNFAKRDLSNADFLTLCAEVVRHSSG